MARLVLTDTSITLTDIVVWQILWFGLPNYIRY